MFCGNCGAKLPDGSRFCGSCGAPQAGGPVAPMRAPGVYRAADDVDYTLYGDDMQLVEIELDQSESVIAEAGAMCFMEDGIRMETIFGDGSAKTESQGFMGKLGSAAKRALTGESLFMTVFTNDAPRKSHVAFAAPIPGKIIPAHLKDYNGTLICQKNAFLCAAKGVNIDIALQKKLGVGFFGGEGFIMQRLSGDGLVFFNAGGTIIQRDLAPGQTLRMDTGCLVALTSTVDYDVQLAPGVKTALFGGEGIFLATLKGPGTVWMQSLPFSRMADEIISASRKNSGETGGILNNPISEVTGGLGGALSGMIKF